MRVLVVYKYESDHARAVIDYLRDVKRQTGHEIEEMDPDGRDGSAFCSTYDIVEYPTLIALDDRGGIQNMWRGLPLPTISEISYYLPES